MIDLVEGRAGLRSGSASVIQGLTQRQPSNAPREAVMPENGRPHRVLMLLPIRRDSDAMPGLQDANGSVGRFLLRPQFSAPDVLGGFSSPAPVPTSALLAAGQALVSTSALEGSAG
jgi:hypothetical protein